MLYFNQHKDSNNQNLFHFLVSILEHSIRSLFLMENTKELQNSDAHFSEIHLTASHVGPSTILHTYHLAPNL